MVKPVSSTLWWTKSNRDWVMSESSHMLKLMAVIRFYQHVCHSTAVSGPDQGF